MKQLAPVWVFLPLALAAALPAQSPPSRPATVATASRPAVPATGSAAITQKRVTEILGFLARDELAGRDTPSPGLDEAARYLADNFKKAGLLPVGEGESYFHTYEGSGLEFDNKQALLTLLVGDKRTALKPEKDFRVLSASRAFERESVEPQVYSEQEAARRLRRAVPRRPVLVTVSPESMVWKHTAGVRQKLRRGSALGAAPVILIRDGLLPKPVRNRDDRDDKDDQDGKDDQDEKHDRKRLRVAIKVPAARRVQLKLRNVVGYLPGQKKPNEYVLFSAHYDHLGIRMSGSRDGIYNGADDDASGTTAVLALAEAFARSKTRTDTSLMFVCFSGEEKGMLGSRGFADEPPVALDRIRVDINIEMIGRPPAGKRMAAWITGQNLSDFAAIATAGFERANIRVVDFRMATMLFSASDNISLARRGVVAHSISAGSLHADYHRPSDEVSKIDHEHMTAIIRGLYEVGLEFANRDAWPAYNERGRRRLRLDR